MGSSKKTTTQETQIPEATPEEKALMKLMTDALLPAYLEEQGYEVKQTRTTVEDDPRYKNIQDRRARLLEERETISAGVSVKPPLPDEQYGYRSRVREGKVFRRGQGYVDASTSSEALGRIDNQLVDLDNEERDLIENFEPELSYDTRKKEGPELERLREEFGEDSDEYRSAKRESVEKDIRLQAQQEEITRLYMDNTEKFLRGDFSITPEQKEFVETNLRDTRAAVESMFMESRAEVGRTEATLFGTVQDSFIRLKKETEDTRLGIFNALDVVGRQIRETGSTMEKALADTVGINKELLKMGIEDLTGDITKDLTMRMNDRAIALGRDPSDPEYTKEIEENVAKEVGRELKSGTLNLAAMEAQGKLAIAEKIGGELEKLGFTRAEIEAQAGARREAIEEQRGQRELAIRERGGMAREEIGRARGVARLGLEEQAANLRFQIGAGMPPQQVGLGLTVTQFQEALAQQRLANAQAGIQAGLPLIDVMQRERLAQPTVTSTTRTPYSFQSAISDITGIAGGIAGIYTGFGTQKALTGLLGGGGSGVGVNRPIS